MAIKLFLEKIFLGEALIEKIDSGFNGEINVYDSWFGKSMRIGRITQSGELVNHLWKVGINEIHNSKFQNHKSLILGLGAGNAARLISKRWPEAKIIGVEIDPKVVEVGKKYFGLDKIKNLEIVVGDAFDYVENPDPQSPVTNHQSLVTSHQSPITNRQSPVTKYDLILVDLYQGKEYPKRAEEDAFINALKEILAKDGVVIFNRLSYQEYAKPANEFAKKLSDFFPNVWTKKAATNLLIFCQN